MGCRCLKTVKPARQSVRKQNERATGRWFHLVSVAFDEQSRFSHLAKKIMRRADNIERGWLLPKGQWRHSPDERGGN